MRVKRGTQHVKRRKNILKKTKGYRWGRRNQIKKAQTAIMKAGANAFRDRRRKKREFRALWQIRLNAAARLNGTTYSALIHALKLKNSTLDRKVLAQIAQQEPEAFAELVKAVK